MEKLSNQTKRILGVTLVELLVAVAISVTMMLAVSVIFKSTTKASGRALALNEIMRQARALTQQLKQDFRGLRKDLPLAVIYQARQNYDTDDPDAIARYDRIVFFANGDFQDLAGGASGNWARIFYGQSGDTFPDNPDAVAPPRRILTRRQKIMTSDLSLVTPVDQNTSSVEYDDDPLEGISLTVGLPMTIDFWKNLPAGSYDNLFINNYELSFIRRPMISESAAQLGGNAVQRMYLLPDVANFEIDIWGIPGYPHWFPDLPRQLLFVDQGGPVGLYYNIPPPLNPDYPCFQLTSLPKALKFTFTLFDKNRRHFPEGKTFSYIIKL